MAHPRSRRSLLICIACLSGLTPLAWGADDGRSAPTAPPFAFPECGGTPTYDAYAGTATIIGITKEQPYGPSDIPYVSYERFDVTFRFAPDTPGKTWLATEFFSRKWSIQLRDGDHTISPGPKFIRKYGITVGRTYPCTFKVLSGGCAVPWDYTVTGIDQRDLFEKGDTRRLEEIEPISATGAIIRGR